ncbi:MAG: hypothetical protein J3K34DRAFT_402255 [Monoraphidium minutum]|nr:MAG: hypothetical protein J3K34DRAFT_402255 [Monoraphidium minutum]
MARTQLFAVLLVALLCSGGALGAPLRSAGVTKPLGGARQLKSQDGLLGGLLFHRFANNWLARRGLTTFGNTGGAATTTATATVDPTLMGLLGGGNAFAAARAIVGGGMDMDTAAWSLLNAAQGGNAAAVASAFATTAGMDQGSFTNLFTRAAAMAMAQGGGMQAGFVTATAQAFAVARTNGVLTPFAMAAADAMAQAGGMWGAQFGGEFAGMFGAAMAQAVAAGNDGAVVEATATVFCSGTNAQATAFSQAVAQSITVNPITGCVIVQKVVARAQAMCANGVATAMAQSFVTRQILPGTCNVFGFFPQQQQQQQVAATATATVNGGGNPLFG